MSTTLIYRKTAQGVEAIAMRHPGLVAKQRSLLIMIDGRRSIEELCTLGTSFGDVNELARELLAQGFIEPVLQGASPAPTADAAQPRVPLAQAQRRAVRRLNEVMGPAGTELCLRLEACRTAQEFRAVIQRVEAILREVVGPQKAARFVEETEKLGLP